MANYTPTNKPVSTFRVEEGYVSFYAEADFEAGFLRSDVTPLGTYLFYNGLTLTVSHQEHSPEQGWGQSYNNLRAPKSVSTEVALSALYTQEPLDGWIDAGSSILRIYIDYLDSSLVVERELDTLNDNGDLVQTIVVAGCLCTSRKISGSDDQSVTYTVNFSGGEAKFLANTTMD